MKGFTLVEVLVVAAITVMLTGFLLANFSRTRVDLNQISLSVEDGIREAHNAGSTLEDLAKSIVSSAKEQNRRLPGFGHRVHTADPRTKRLFELAASLGVAGEHVRLSLAIEAELERSSGKKLPINVDGAIAAVSSDMGFDWRLGKAFFLLGRVAGLTAQVYEEQTQEKPMRDMFSIDYEYTGPGERDLK